MVKNNNYPLLQQMATCEIQKHHCVSNHHSPTALLTKNVLQLKHVDPMV